MKPRRRKCIICISEFSPYRSTQKACSPQCAIEYGIRQTAKREQKTVREYKKKLKAERMAVKEKLKPIKQSLIKYKKLCQSEVQLIARLIDYGCNCLALDRPPNTCHGGHVYARKGNSNFGMNLHNIFLQTAQSNHFQNDDGLMRDGVVRVFGQHYLDFITSLKSTPVQKYTNEDYKLFLQKARVISKQLTEWNNQIEQPARSATSRIQLRNWANIELGIYPNEFLNF